MFVRIVTIKKLNENAPSSPANSDAVKALRNKYVSEGKLLNRSFKQIDNLTVEETEIWDSKEAYDEFWNEPVMKSWRQDVIAPFIAANPDVQFSDKFETID